jgi:hypothetical protein
MRLLPLILQRCAQSPLTCTRVIAFCLAALSVALPVHAQQPSPAPAFATMQIGGNYFRRSVADSKYTILSMYIDRDAGMKGDVPSAGLATFGWFESGEVMLLQYVEYLPSILHASARRNVKPSKWPLDPQATPRYMMVCAWPLDDKRVPGKVAAAYGERDDANIKVKKSSVGTLINVRWDSIPAARAAKNFAAKDYCTEISKTKKSSAPLWLTTTTE